MERCIECHADSCYYRAYCECDCHNNSEDQHDKFRKKNTHLIGEYKPLDPNFKIAGKMEESSVVHVGERKPLDPDFRPTGGKMNEIQSMKETFCFYIDTINKNKELYNKISFVPSGSLWHGTLSVYLTAEQLKEIENHNLKVTITAIKTDEELLREEKLKLLKELDAVTPLTPELALKAIEEFDSKHK